jgi:5'-nucleotidase
MLILVDQDNVLADFDGGFLAAWRETHPDAPFIPHSQRRAWNVRDDLPAEHQAAAVALYSREGFFGNLAPIAGGREALFAMLDLGWDVRICTSPIREYRHCVAEKFAWVEAHLGSEWLDRIVLTADKTLVHGDWLIDDKPDIHGGRVPSWRHALFDAHHNRHIGHGLRIDWSNWREVLSRSTDQR